ncbi:MAG TPA: peptidylprolyl isomerase [Bacteroidia bacterium]
MKKLFLLISAFLVVSLGAIAQKKAAKPKLSKEDKEFLNKQQDGIYAKIETTKGIIYTKLEYKIAPLAASNYIALAEGKMKNSAKPDGTPYYDGGKFHRVIPGFMIQGGCPLGNGMGDPGYSFDDELDPTTETAKNGYKRGVMAMANRGPNTNGSQFFLMHKDYGLPHSYTIFGSVVQGIEVVDSIAATPRDKGDKPLTDVSINSVRILRKGKDAEAYDAVKGFEDAKIAIAKKKEEQQKAAMEATNKILAEKYADAKTTASGLRYIMVKEGTGAQPTVANSVVIHYEGSLLVDGKVFDGSIGKGDPVTFPLSRMIAGWQEGVPLMKAGGKIKMIIPPNLGYGERGYPGVIPPNSWLVFDVELFDVK